MGRLITVVVLLIAFPPVADMEVRAATPLIGAQVSPPAAQKLCDSIRRDNNRATSLWVKWSEVPRSKSGYDWKALDREIAALHSCGLAIGLHVQSSHKRNFQLPDLEQYSAFLHEMAARYKGKVQRYSVENEASSGRQWQAPPQTYFDLLTRAAATIRKADPAAIIENSGLSSGTVAMLVVDDLYRNGRIAEALALAQTASTHMAGGGKRGALRERDLAALSRSPDMAKKREWIHLLRKHGGSYDALQLHFYGEPHVLPLILDWVKAQRFGKPFTLWELSQRRKRETIDDSKVAEDMAKLIATAVGEGSQFTLYYSYVDWQAPGGFFPGLINSSGSPREEIQTAFRVLTENIGTARSASRLDLAPDVTGYAFHDSARSTTSYVVWSAKPAAIELPASRGSAALKAIDLRGRVSPVTAKRIAVSSSPLIIVETPRSSPASAEALSQRFCPLPQADSTKPPAAGRPRSESLQSRK